MLRYQLPRNSAVRLAVYHVTGRRVRFLVAERVPAGYHSVVWHDRDENGHVVASGVYLARFEAGGVRDPWRLSVLR